LDAKTAPQGVTIAREFTAMARGFVYLAAVVDWFSRRVLSHLRNAFGAQLRSGYALPASHAKCASHQGRKPGSNPLISTAKLFRRPEPPLC